MHETDSKVTLVGDGSLDDPYWAAGETYDLINYLAKNYWRKATSELYYQTNEGTFRVQRDATRDKGFPTFEITITGGGPVDELTQKQMTRAASRFTQQASQSILEEIQRVLDPFSN